jgi:N-methylhydantoinase A
MANRVAVDVGGTFTDLVLIDEEQMMKIAKSPTTPENQAYGVRNCVHIVAEELGIQTSELMKECEYFAHGSTVITNAVIEGKVSKVGLLVTRGFRDILTIREGGKDDPYNMHEDYPKPYVPRYLTLPITERVNSEGDIEIPIDEAEAVMALKKLIEEFKVDTVAVCFLWSIANPTHERIVNEIVAKKWPQIPCILSTEVNPIIREYRRTSSTVIEASIRPLAQQYISRVDSALKEDGYQGTLYIITSSGSVLAASDAFNKSLSMISSGPSMAPVAARWVAEIEGDPSGNVISIDMGGTSFDVSMVKEGQIARTRETKISRELLGISTIDSRSIGAGGGSIAWIDQAGLIHLGPQSAGAVPGPACYNRGGEKATVTDANVILGYIDPDYFLGGRMKIFPDLAAEAIMRNVAKPLKLDLQEAAFTIWSTINVNMVSAIQDVTIWQGIDPREYTLVSGGGASNCHAVALAKELGMQKILIPKFGAVLSAVGGLVADVSAEFSGSCFTSTDRFNSAGVNDLLNRLEIEGQFFLNKLKTKPEKSEIELYVEARYPYQVWELPVKLRTRRILKKQELLDLSEDFHLEHEKVFGIKEPSGHAIECVHWSARAIAEMGKVQLKEQEYGGDDPSAGLVGDRMAYFRELGGMVKTGIFRGDKLSFGNIVKGPAIIEEAITTIVVPPYSRAIVTKWGNYSVEIGS